MYYFPVCVHVCVYLVNLMCISNFSPHMYINYTACSYVLIHFIILLILVWCRICGVRVCGGVVVVVVLLMVYAVVLFLLFCCFHCCF